MNILRVKDRENIVDVLSRVNTSFPGYGIKMDNSLGFSPDAFAEMNDTVRLKNFFTIRLDKNGNIRIPTAKRTPIYVGEEIKRENGVIYRTDRSSKTEKGYCIIDELVICAFSALSIIMTSPELGPRMCSGGRLENEIARLDRIYKEIPEFAPVSVYFSNKVILGC